MKINIHKIISGILIISILCLFVFTPFYNFTAQASYNPNSQRFAAWVASAITALNIALTPVGATIQDLNNYIVDPANIVYTYQEENLDSYFNQSNIQIIENGTLIDGQFYDDVWLSHDAAEKFRTNAFDFKTAYSLTSNSNGTFASGTGFYDDVPIYDLGNNVYRSQSYSVPAQLGTYNIGPCSITNTRISENGRTVYYTGTYPPNSTPTTESSSFTISEYFVFQTNSNFTQAYFGVLSGSNFFEKSRLSSDLLNNSPFDFDWVSGVIPAEQDFTADDGLLIHIPHGHASSTLAQFIEDNPEFAQSGGVTVDPYTDPDIYSKLGDLADVIAPIIPIINAEFTDVIPSPEPVPSQVTIADQQYNILQSALDGIQDVLDSIWQSILSIPSAISSLIQPILEDIEIAPIKVFDKALDLISSIFAPVFAIIRSGLSVWSYVVSWFNSITGPLNFILSCLSSTPIILYPVYAVIAAALCIAIWRRFGH